MIRFLKITTILLLFILLSKIANSLTSSSYLIANEAISSLDYETASNYFNDFDYTDFSIKEFRKKIISYRISFGTSHKIWSAKIDNFELVSRIPELVFRYNVTKKIPYSHYYDNENLKNSMNFKYQKNL